MPVVPEWRLGPDWEGEAIVAFLLRFRMECAHKQLSSSAITGFELQEVVNVALGGALGAVGDNKVQIAVRAVEFAQPFLQVRLEKLCTGGSKGFGQAGLELVAQDRDLVRQTRESKPDGATVGIGLRVGLGNPLGRSQLEFLELEA
jgi:hypothetical protein